MKLMMVIVNEEYQRFVSEFFQEKGYPATVVASTGDFLQYGDTIFLIGVDEGQASVIIKSLSKGLGDCENLLNGKQNNAVEQGNSLKKANIFYMDVFQYAKISRGETVYDRSESEGTEVLSGESRERMDKLR